MINRKHKGIYSIQYNFLGKPVRMKFSDGKVITYVYDAGGNKLTQKLYNGDTLKNTTDYVNGFVYENGALSFFGSPEGRVVNNGGTLEYQYAIADHQGNTRVVFSSVSTPATSTADFESSSNDEFMNYPSGASRSSLALFNHTPSGSYSQKLTGASNSQVGVAKSIKVYPGDKVKIEAYAKYYNPSGTTSNITGFALALTGAFGVTSSSTGEALKAYNTLNNYGGIIAAGGSGGSSEFPKLFVNILLFDKDFNFLDAAWEQIDGGEQVGVTPTDHDYMSKEVTVKEAGYAYVFVSNENPTLVEFYVDDVVVTHTPTNVIQYNEYYPFGLSASTSWTRENAKDNNYLYNAANELNKTSGWYEMFYRGYDPAIGRMLQVDPYATMYASFSTYNYALNNPVMMNDPSGGLVSVDGYTGGQLRAMYRNDFYNHGYSGSFGDWASDNIDFGSGGTTVIGTDGREYGANKYGQTGYWRDESSIEEDSEGSGGYQWRVKTMFVETGTQGSGPGLLERFWNHPLVRAITGDAINISVDLSGFAIGGVSLKPVGVIVPLRGRDALKLYGYTDMGVGMGLDVSATLNFGKQWYLGDVNDITGAMFQGIRFEANASVSIGVDIGVSASYAATETGYGILGHSVNFGVGVPVPLPVSGNANIGYTNVWGQ